VKEIHKPSTLYSQETMLAQRVAHV
jgi:hypothetical protein